jgi:hypothetical protein
MSVINCLIGPATDKMPANFRPSTNKSLGHLTSTSTLPPLLATTVSLATAAANATA